jgi:glycosyltransferase involved in cell wall biosynthesis
VSYDTGITRSLPRYNADQPISVVLICRDKAQSLPYVLSALARNTRRPDLVVLSDDASTDESPSIFAELCTGHQLAYETVLHPFNGLPFRLNTLRNDGIKVCKEGLIIILDADHVPARTHIESHLELHLKHQRGILSTGPRLEYVYPDCSGPINFMWGHESISMLQSSTTEPVPTWTTVLVSNMGVTKQAILQLGGFDPIYDGNYGLDDVDFTYRAWKSGYYFAASFEAYVIHIPHPMFSNRDSEINLQKFKEKYGFDFTYPPLISSMCRAAWHNYYQHLIAQYASKPTGPQIVVQMLDLKTVSGKVLLKVMLGRILRRAYRTVKPR